MMSDETPASFAHTIADLEQCLAILERAEISSHDLDFLHTFLTHAKGYLARDISPDTEALENWDTPENQAMIQRYITHVEQEIRMIAEEWQHSSASAAQTSLSLELRTLLTRLESQSRWLNPNSPDSMGFRGEL